MILSPLALPYDSLGVTKTNTQKQRPKTQWTKTKTQWTKTKTQWTKTKTQIMD